MAAAFLVLAVTSPHFAAAQEADEAITSPDAEAAAAKSDSGGDGVGEGPKRSHPARRRHRNVKTRKGGKFVGRVVPDEQLRKDALPRPSGNLHIVNLVNVHDEAKVNIYNSDGSYNLDAVAELNHVLRCRRTDVEKPMDPQLLSILSRIYDHFGGKPLQIVSGYRNQRKLSSNHTKGTASDIRISGVSIKQIRDFADTLDRGGMGIGIYPRGQFVHVDVRSPPSYRWTDYSPPNPDAAEKRPPRGWKRKKLQS